MKDIKIKQTNIVVEKKIQKDIFFYESILDNVDTKSFIKEIELGINSKDNMNHRTNVHGQMTSWNYFDKNVHLNEILSFCLDHFKLDSKMPNSYLADSWGIKMKKNCFTRPHDHGEATLSGIIYLNTMKNSYVEFPELDFKTKIIKNKIILFSGNLTHQTKRITNNNIKYALSFNFRRNRNW